MRIDIMKIFPTFIQFLSESKRKNDEDELNEGEGGVAAGGGDAGGDAGGDSGIAASGNSDGDAAYMHGGRAITTAEDILGKYDPSKGCMGKGDFHIPKMIGKLQHRWPCCNGGSKRKKDKNGKDKKYYPEKGMKVITSYADLTEDQKSSLKPVLVYNIPFNKVPEILDNTTIENQRFDRSQFIKYLDGSDQRDLEIVGLFAEFPKECLAMAVLAFDFAKADDCYICEIQSFKKGYGKELILKLMKYQKKLWLMANTLAGEKLLDFYRDPMFKFEEYVVPNSIYGCPAYFFYSKECDEDKLRGYIDAFYSQDDDLNESKNKLTAHPKVIQQRKASLKAKTTDKAKKIVAVKTAATKENMQAIKQDKLKNVPQKKVIANQLRSKQSKMQSKKTIKQKEIKDFKQVKIAMKKISFPGSEIEKLKKQDRIVTTRVSEDYDKYQLGDIVETSWKDQYKVIGRKNISCLSQHPYESELTDDQREELSKHDKMAVLTLALQKQKKMNESNYDVAHKKDADEDLLKSMSANKEIQALIPDRFQRFFAFGLHKYTELKAIFGLRDDALFTSDNKWYLIASMSSAFCNLAKQRAFALKRPSKADAMKSKELIKQANAIFSRMHNAHISFIDDKFRDVSNDCRPSYASQSNSGATTFKSFGIGQEAFLYQVTVDFDSNV